MTGLPELAEEELPENRDVESASPEARRKAALEHRDDPAAGVEVVGADGPAKFRR